MRTPDNAVGIFGVAWRKIVPLFVTMTASAVLADTTIVKVTESNFPYDEHIRVLWDGDIVRLECSDNYGKKYAQRVKVEEMLAAFDKGLEWAELNRSVKANVTKELNFWGAKFTFRGIESGSSYFILSTGSVCSLRPSRLSVLVKGFRENRESARLSEAENKEALFK